MQQIMTTEEAVAGLRAAADWLESHGDTIGKSWYAGIDAYNLTAEQLAAVAASPGTWEKDGTDTMFELTRRIGPFEISVHASRSEVCVAVPTGRKTTARKCVTPAVYEDVEVDEVEWRCEPLLAKRVEANA